MAATVAQVSEPTQMQRLAGAAVGLFGFLALLLAAVWIADAAGVRLDGQAIGRAAGPVGFGAAVIGWKWPRSLLRPFSLLSSVLRRRR